MLFSRRLAAVLPSQAGGVLAKAPTMVLNVASRTILRMPAHSTLLAAKAPVMLPVSSRRAYSAAAHCASRAAPLASKVPSSARRAYSIPARESSYLMDGTGTETYSSAASYFHWLMAAGIVVIVASVKIAQNSTPAQRKRWNWSKAELMNLHKSVALIMAAMIVPRIAVRLWSFAPPLSPGPVVEHVAAHTSHAFMYAFMIGLPASGITMAWYSGKGLPFFKWTFQGAKEADGKKAKYYYALHKQMGQVFTYLVPLHIGATAIHAWRGQNLFTRFRFN